MARSQKDLRNVHELSGQNTVIPPPSEEELGSVLDEHPDTVYNGTGQYGDLPVTPEALEFLKPYEPVLMPTPDLLSMLEKEKRRYIAFIHVTC
jgi:hypothetical protein